MKKFELYDKVSAATTKEQLPTGGYVCKILKAEEVQYAWGEVLVVHFDIEQGPYKGFYRKDYDSQDSSKECKWRGSYRLNQPNGKSAKADEYNASQFKGFTQAVEQSNSGYKWGWDEETLKGKLVGLVFGEEEWEMDGRSGMTVRARYATGVDGVESAKVPRPKMKYKGTGATTQPPVVQAEEDDELPF